MIRDRLAHTRTVLGIAIRRRDALAVTVVVAAVYLVGYLWLTQHLSFTTGAAAGGFDLLVVDDPLSRTFERRGPLQYESIAVLTLGPATLLFAPINAVVGGAIAGLVGLNVALSYLAIVQPAACGFRAGAGVFAAVPALLSGSACCAPVILLVIGIQASTALLTVFAWLLPIGVLALLGSLVWVADRVAPVSG